jgi:hypothetical protein
MGVLAGLVLGLFPGPAQGPSGEGGDGACCRGSALEKAHMGFTRHFQDIRGGFGWRWLNRGGSRLPRAT